MATDRLAGFGLAPATAGPRGRRWLGRLLFRPSLAATVVLAAVVLFFGLRTPEMLSPRSVASLLDTAAPLGIGGVAIALLLIAGQFDLTIGIVAMGSSLLTALLVGWAGWGVWPALCLSLAAAVAVGALNGVLVVTTRLPSFLITLGTFLVLQGVTDAGTDLFHAHGGTGDLATVPGWSSAAAVFGANLEVGGGRFRVSLLWWLGLTAVATWGLWRTRFGNAVLASGGARRAARELGVPVRRTTVLLFCLTAAAGWLIGTLRLAQLGSVQMTGGLTSEVDFIIVAVLGGCLISGGYGSALGAAVGALLYATTRQGILLAGWDPRWVEVVLGVLLLVALVANGVVRSRLRTVPRS